jgi:hypothetical protein
MGEVTAEARPERSGRKWGLRMRVSRSWQVSMRGALGGKATVQLPDICKEAAARRVERQGKGRGNRA